MSTVNGTLRNIGNSWTRFVRSLVDAVITARQRRADAQARAICPNDNWAFTPLYTDGACPLCGWVPEGYEYHAPLLTPYERYWGAMAAILAASVVMGLVVVVAVTKG